MRLFFSLLFGLVAFARLAQQGLPPQLSAAPVDSVARLRQVFRHSRRLGRGLTFASGVGVGFGVEELALARSPSARQVLSLFVIGLSAAYVVQGIVNWRRYSQIREEEAVRRFERHQPQPLYLQRRLLGVFTTN